MALIYRLLVGESVVSPLPGEAYPAKLGILEIRDQVFIRRISHLPNRV